MTRADVEARPVVVAAGAVGATLLLAGLAVLLLLRHWQLAPGSDRPPAAAPLPARVPVLDSAPQSALSTYRLDQQRQLGTLAWADRSRGLVQVPIGDALVLRARPASGAGR